jgi:prepilin-type N-terminal cleavage/methylation domain-containing protein
MVRKKAFTLIELLVVISIIALLIAILMPALNRAREQAKAVQCMSNIRQMATAMALYAEDHDGAIMGMSYGEKYWFRQIAPYLGDKSFKTDTMDSKGTKGIMQIGICPSTKIQELGPDPESSKLGTNKLTWYFAWDPDGGTQQYMFGSYAVNSWVLEDVYGWADEYAEIPEEYYYSYKRYLSSRSDVPVFCDAIWMDAWPKADDNEAAIDVTCATYGSSPPDIGMVRNCIDRHSMAVNVGFQGTNVERVPLEQLWTLNWHKNFRPRFDVILPEN